MRTIHAVAGLISTAFFLAQSAAAGQTLPGHVPAAVGHLQPIGGLAATNRLKLAIALPLRNQAALTQLLGEVTNPAHPNYRKYLTPEQFTERFGPTETDYQVVVDFAKSQGFAIKHTHPNRMLVDVEGPVAVIERAFHLKMGLYADSQENRTFYAPENNPMLDLSVPILHISGLDNYALPKPRLHPSPLDVQQSAASNSGSGPDGYYMGKDFRAAYVPNSTLTGSGQMVGLLEFDGYTASDIAYYENQTGLPSVPLSNVLLDGASGAPSGLGGEVEVSLDIEMAVSMAPGLAKIIVYEAPNGEGNQYWHDMLNRMVTDNLAKQLSCSWYIPGGGPDAVADQIFQEMAAQGQSFFTASGDSDAYVGAIDFPSESPYITQVGGTTLTTSGPGGAWVSEKVWNWGDGQGSSGGISTDYPIPSWQAGVNMTQNQGSTTMRNIPDVALTADNVYVRVDGGTWEGGGTSCAAPLWAGFTALINQLAQASGEPPVGFINPAIYALGKSPSYTACLHDITTGNNESYSSPTKFSAVTGFDLCTGWGTPTGIALINAIGIPESLNISPAAALAFTGPVGGPFSPVAQAYSLTNCGAGTLNWTLTTGVSWLTASPSSGLLVFGGPAAAVSLSVASSAATLPAGNYAATVWFTNQNDHFGQNRAVSLAIVTAPVITSQPTNFVVLQGETGAFSVQVATNALLQYQWCYNNGASTTNLTDGGNIYGSSTATLTLSAASFTNAGNYFVVVSNAAGSVVSSSATLTVLPQCVSITTPPTNQTAVVGTTANLSVAADGTPPLGYQWIFNGANLAGATNALLSLTNVQYSEAGSYSVLVSNMCGLVVASSNATLTVLAAPPCDPPPANIVSWWRAEGDATDFVGGNSGVLSNGVTFAAGEVNQAFSFNGSNSFVQVPDAPALELTNELTIEFWVKRQRLNYYDYVVEKGGDWTLGTQNYAVALHIASYNYCLHFLFNGGWRGAGSIGDLNWHHCAITARNGDVDPTIYIDGVQQVITYREGASTIDLYPSSKPLHIGAQVGPYYSYYSKNLIDELSFYSRVLSAAEIQSIYTAATSGKCVVPMSPVIVSQPANQNVNIGDTANFTVNASGTGPLFYQWNFNGGPILGATTASLALTNAQLAQAGNYAVLVTNALGAVLSSNAVLTVNAVPPSIVSQPASQTVVFGTNASFSVTASGSPPLSYQWEFNGSALTGATNNVLTLTDVQLDEEGIYAVLVTNAFGSVLSSNAVLTVQVFPPVIASQPTGQTVVVGANASFGVTASGSPPLSYQWEYNGSALSGATNSVLALTNVQLGQAGTYAVLVTNDFGAVLSSNAVLTVNSAPTCAPLPDGAISWWRAEDNASDTLEGNNGILSNGVAFVSGEVGSAFGFNGSNSFVQVPDAPSLRLTNELTIEFWVKRQRLNYYDYVVEKGGDWSEGTQNYAVALHISEYNYCLHFLFNGGWRGAGSIGDLNWHHCAVTARNGDANPTFYIDGVLQPLSISQGASAISLYPSTKPLHIGAQVDPYWSYYSKNILDELTIYDRILSASEIQSIYAAGAIGKCAATTPPIVISQPTNQTANVGSTVRFAVTAAGSPPLSFQWNLNGSALPGATAYSLTLANVQTNQAGIYTVLVTNSYGSTLSSNAVLTVNAFPPAIVSQPASQTVFIGSNVTFSVTASGSPPLSYQWEFNGASLPGATAASLALTNVQLSQAGNYALLVTNAFGYVLSSNAVLTVNAVPPTISAQPASQTVFVGATVNFSVAASGTLPLHYQWLFNGAVLAAQTSSALTLPNVQMANAGNYSVVVTNLGGSILSSNAVLTVLPPEPCQPAPPNILAWWRAEGNATDAVGTNSGFLTNGATFASGKVGQAFDFNGTNSFVQVPDAPAIRLTNVLTIEFWVKRQRLNYYDYVVEKGGDWTLGTQNYAVALHIASYNYCLHFLFNGGWRGAGSIGDLNWHHCAIIATNGAPDPIFYIDGMQQTISYRSGASTINLYPSTKPLHIGAQVGPYYNYYSMNLIDELSFYNRALSASEIQSIYAAGSNGKCPMPPVIATQPQNQQVLKGGTAAFNVAVTGTAPFSYQWSFQGTNIAAATTSALTLTNVQPKLAGNYAVLVANASGSVLSSNAVLTVLTSPTITNQPVSQLALLSCSLDFSVGASGTAPLCYQWWKDGSALTGQTNAVFNLPDIQSPNFGSYSVVVTNAYGALTSSIATLALDHLPVAGPVSVSRFAAGGVRVNVADLLANDTDADGDWLTVIGVSSVSDAGGTVSLSGNYILYYPPASFTNSDSWTYTITDGHCGAASSGTVTVQVKPDDTRPLNLAAAKWSNGSIWLSFDGIPGFVYRLQYTDSLLNPNWQDISSQQADTFGVSQVFDNPTNAPVRFYRAVWP